MASGPITSWQIDGETEQTVADFIFRAPKSLQMVIAAMKLKDAYSLEGKLYQPRQHIEKQRHYFVNKGPSSQAYGFPSGHVWMWELDYKENWAPKNWCFWIVVLEKTLESPLDCKEIQPVDPKGDKSWVFIGRTDVEAETPILCPPDAKCWLIGKDPDAGRDWGQEEKGTTEDEMVGWHHRLNGHGFGWTPGVGDGQGGLVHGVAKSQTWLSDLTELIKSLQNQIRMMTGALKSNKSHSKLRWWNNNNNDRGYLQGSGMGQEREGEFHGKSIDTFRSFE